MRPFFVVGAIIGSTSSLRQSNHCFSDELSLLAGFFGLPHPIVRGELGEDLHGCFLKDYSPSNW